MKKIALQPVNETCLVETGGTLLSALLKRDLKVQMSCGGRGLCSTCHVWLTKGQDNVSPVGKREERTLRLVADRRPESRLACQCQIFGDGVVVEVPEAMYIESADDLLVLLGASAGKNILHPITGAVLIPKGKLITRTLLEQSRGLEAEVRAMKAGDSGNPAALADSTTHRRFLASGAGGGSSVRPTPRTNFDPRVVVRRGGTPPPPPPMSSRVSQTGSGSTFAPRRTDPSINVESNRVPGSGTVPHPISSGVIGPPPVSTNIHAAGGPASAAGNSLLRAGTQVGKYLLLECIGRGGGGMVFRALHTKLNTLVAIKFLRPDLLGSDPGSHARFTREAQLLAQLVHPHVVRVLDYEDEPGRPYVVMEFIDGLSAADLIKQGGRVAAGRAVEIALHVLEGLEAARRLGVVHRDVKPGNILLTRDGLSKLVDFGLAVVTRPDDGGGDGPPAEGTVGYMSPEQATGSPVDHRADQYSLGCTLYHLVTGRLPFSGKSAHQVILQHIRQAPPAPHEVSPGVPEALSRIILRTLEKSPADRYADHAALRVELAAFRKGDPGYVNGGSSVRIGG